MEGEPANYSDPEQCKKVIRLLARLHAATELTMEEAGLTLAEIVERECEAIDESVQVLKPDIRHLFMGFIPSNSEFSNMGNIVADAVRSERMARLALRYGAREREPLRVCHIHGDTHPMNYLFDDEGRLHLLDLDYIRPDAAFLDLARPMGKMMRRYQWDGAFFDALIAEYTAIRPLARWELMLLLARLTFPAPIVKLMKKRRKLGPIRKRVRRIELVKAKVHHALLGTARNRFLREACVRHDLQLGLTVLDSETFDRTTGRDSGSGKGRKQATASQ